VSFLQIFLKLLKKQPISFLFCN